VTSARSAAGALWAKAEVDVAAPPSLIAGRLTPLGAVLAVVDGGNGVVEAGAGVEAFVPADSTAAAAGEDGDGVRTAAYGVQEPPVMLTELVASAEPSCP
jgi:hypothetical protein